MADQPEITAIQTTSPQAGGPVAPADTEGSVVTAATSGATVPALSVAAPLPQKTGEEFAGSLHRELRGPVLLGMAILIGFFGIGGGWASTAPVAGAAIASGVVSPEGSRQRIQHLEGGIVREIRAREGARVQAGDTLIVLDAIGASSEMGQLTSRLQSLAATEARLQAERKGADTIVFDHPSLSNRDDPEVKAVIQQQINQFATRRANDASQEAILTQRIAQLQDQIEGTEKQLVSVRRQNELIIQEVGISTDMFNKGYEKKSRLLGLQREEAQLTGQEGQLLSSIAKYQEQIGETKLQTMNVRVKRREDIDQDLAQTQARRAEVEQQIKQSADKLARTDIVAPVSGTVMELRFKTAGGVVRPGEEVMSIVPDKDELIVDARISTHDVDDVHAGQQAYVIFPSFSQRNLHRIEARVRSVSPDAFQEEKSGQTFYTAKIEVNRKQLAELDPDVVLTPGMPAEAFITTKERTVLDYVIQPYLLVIEHSLRER